MSRIERELNELERHLDFQAEQKRHYQREAGRILRVTLTSLGLVLAFSSLTANLLTVDVPQITFSAVIDYANQIGRGIGTTGLSAIIGQLISVQTPYLITCLGLLTADSLFIQVPKNAYSVLSPDPISPSMPIRDDGRVDFSNHERGRNYLKGYRQAVSTNRSLLEEDQRSLRVCYQSIKTGILALFGTVALFSIYFLLSSSAWVLVAYPAGLYLLFIVLVSSNRNFLASIRNIDTRFELWKIALTLFLALSIASEHGPMIPLPWAVLITSGSLPLFLFYHFGDDTLDHFLTTMAETLMGMFLFIGMAAVSDGVQNWSVPEIVITLLISYIAVTFATAVFQFTTFLSLESAKTIVRATYRLNTNR